MNILGRRKKDEKNELLLEIPDFPQNTSYFGKSMVIQGDVTGDDNLQMDGKIEGSILLTSDLHVNKSAIINGNIKANSITSSGIIKGNITATHKLSLDKTAKVNGKIITSSISMNEGAIFDGEMEMDARKVKK